MGGAVALTPVAEAAPPTSAWGATAGGSAARVTASTPLGSLATVALATDAASASSTATPRTDAVSQNIGAVAAGLPLTVASSRRSAPPDLGAPLTAGLAAAVTGVVDLGALTTTNEAHWSLDTACVTGGALSASSTRVESLAVFPAVSGGLLSTGAATSTGRTELVANSGLNYGVRSVSTGQIAGVNVLGSQVSIAVGGTSTLTATAPGTSTGTFSYAPASVDVTALGSTVRLTPAAPTRTVNLAVGSVTVTLNTPSVSTTATSSTASVSLLTIAIRVPDFAPVTTATFDVLPMSASATAPSGGIDCPAPPAAPVITSPANGSSTSATRPPISGTADPGAQVEATIDGTSIGTTTADGGGAWSLTPATPLAAGSHRAIAVATTAGGPSAPSNAVDFTVDTTAPAPPVITVPAAGSSTNDTTPDISGTAEPNSTVTARVDGTPVGTTTASGAGTWTVTPTTPLAQGAHSATATATDAAGNVSGPSTAVPFTIDTVAPAAPVIANPAEGSTTTLRSPPISGTAEPNAEVGVQVDGAAAGTARATASGAWTMTSVPPLADGPHVAVATATDAAGNVSPPSAARGFTVDATAPLPPTIANPVNGSVTNNPAPTYSGAAEAGSTVALTVDGAPAGTTTATGGTWSITPLVPLTDGVHSASATATDAVGNVSSPSATVSFTVDTVAPAAPVILTPANGSSTADSTPSLSGTAEPGSSVAVRVDGALVGSPTASPTGTWSIDPTTPLADGPHTVTARATDAAGNSGATASNTFTVDTAAPAAPVITSPANGAHTPSSTPPIAGTAEPGSTVSVSVDGTPIGSAVATGGTWSVPQTAPLGDGPHTATAVARDAAGNTSPTATTTFVVDTAAPAAPVILSPADGSRTANRTPPISGTSEPGSTVTVVLDATTTLTATTTGAGTWSVTPTAALAEGAHVIRATATDAAGNVSPPAVPVTFTVDVTAPAAPVILTPAQGASVPTGTPTLSGTAEPGSTLTVRVDGTVIGTAAAPAGGWSLVPSTPLADGSHTATATATDAAGNAGPSSATRDFIVDTAAPAAPAIDAPADGSVIADPTPTVSGSAEPGSRVTVAIDGIPVGTAIASGAGLWSVPTTVPLSDAAHTATATATDAAGNTGPAASSTFTVDTTAPAAPTITSPANGSTIGDATPEISGTAEPGSTVAVTIDGTPVGTAVVGPGGLWTRPTTTPLSDAVHIARATATDAAGNTGPLAASLFTVDTTGPAAPVISTPANGSTTADSTPTISGTAEAGSTVAVSIDGTPLGTAPAGVGGAWTITPVAALADGGHTVTASAADALGNVGPSATSTFTVDTTAPAAPAILTPPNGSTTADSTPTITGSAEPGSTVAVSIDGLPVGSVPAGPGGAWSLTPLVPLTDGPHTISATAADAVGNTSAATTSTVTVDTTGPAAPVIATPATGSTTTDSTPLIGGTAEPGSTVTVIIDGTPVGTTVTATGGAWTFTPTSALADGPHTITATATDAVGNTGPASVPVLVTVDTTAPAAPVISTPVAGSTTADDRPVFSGTAEPLSTVDVSVDGVVVATTTSSPTGSWSVRSVLRLANGLRRATATATDPAGNTGPASAAVAFTVDTVAPAAPVITAPASGAVLSDSTPTVTGTAEPGATVAVAFDGAPAGTAVADGSGAWTFTPTVPLVDGPHTATAAATDAAGNTGPASVPVAFTVDTVAPAPPVITAPTTGALLTTRVPRFAGTAEPLSTVRVLVDGTSIGTTTASGSGAWSFTPTAGLADGPHTVVAEATDPAGNTGARSVPVPFAVDASAPQAPVITAPVDGSATADPTPTVSGTAEPGTVVTVLVDGTPVGTTTTAPGGTWSVTPTTPLPDGTHSITATAVDAAGNAAPTSAPVSVVIDTLAPAAPVIDSPVAGASITDTLPAYVGTAEPDSTVTITVDGVDVGTTTTGPSGRWTFRSLLRLAVGAHTVQARATDAVGNESDPSTVVRFTVAAAAPSATGSAATVRRGLAVTGADAVAPMAAGLVLVVAGAALIALRNRQALTTRHTLRSRRRSAR